MNGSIRSARSRLTCAHRAVHWRNTPTTWPTAWRGRRSRPSARSECACFRHHRVPPKPREVNVLQSDGNTSQLTISPQSATGRQADSVRDQFARDLAEVRSARNDATRSEFQEIKATLDAYRLLAALSHSHGLVVGKYHQSRRGATVATGFRPARVI
ncbi:MAG: hypothetical protein QOD67_2021 [Caballeronia sp.]|nr:hypothetical protein [Caballeronia sp.]